MIMGAWGLGGKKAPTAKSYVQDGLVAMWDGIENAGWGVHDASATTWKNLVADSHNLQLTSAASWDSKSVHGDGTNYIAGLPGADNAISVSGSWTVEVVFSWTKTFVRNNVMILFCNGVTTADNMVILVDGKFVGQQRTMNGADSYIGLDQYTANTKVNLVYTRDSSHRSLSMNNGAVVGTNGGMVGRDGVAGCVLGGTTWNYNLIGDIYCVRIYSRAMTAEEIAANYAIDKKRFNLP